jgi:hypothetical protein
MILGTPMCYQGQIVEVSYGWCDGVYYRRTYDRSDRTESWDYAEDPNEIPDDYDAGGASYPPNVSKWIDCGEPEEE